MIATGFAFGVSRIDILATVIPLSMYISASLFCVYIKNINYDDYQVV